MLRNCWVKWPLNLSGVLLQPHSSSPLAPWTLVTVGRGDSDCRLKVLCADLLSGLLLSCQSHSLLLRRDFLCSLVTSLIHWLPLWHSAFETEGLDNASRPAPMDFVDKVKGWESRTQGLILLTLQLSCLVTLSQALTSPFLPLPLLSNENAVHVLLLIRKCGCWRNL